MNSSESICQVNKFADRKTTIPIQSFQTSKTGLDVAFRTSKVLISSWVLLSPSWKCGDVYPWLLPSNPATWKP